MEYCDRSYAGARYGFGILLDWSEKCFDRSNKCFSAIRLLASAGWSGPRNNTDISEDYDVRVWSLSGQQLLTLKGHGESQVKSMTFSADGNLLATLGKDGTTKIWQIGGLNELLKRGCDWARHYLKHNPNVDESDRNLCDDVKK